MKLPLTIRPEFSSLKKKGVFRNEFGFIGRSVFDALIGLAVSDVYDEREVVEVSLFSDGGA